MGLKVKYVRIDNTLERSRRAARLNHLIPTQVSRSAEVSGVHSLWAPKQYPDFQIQIISINIISSRRDWSSVSPFID